MSNDAFRAERLTGLGGSDAAAALGISKWKTPLQLYMEKRGEIPPVEETEPMRWGVLLEPVIRQEYANQTGREVMRVPMARHARHKHMIAHFDGIVKGRGIFEAKTARSPEGWGEPGSDEIPQEYLIQVQHYLLVSGLPLADVAALFGGSDFRIYTVEADRELQEMIVDGEHEFWERVQKAVPPDPVNLEDVNLRYGRFSRADPVNADAEALATFGRLVAARDAIHRLEAEKDTHEMAIKSYMGEHDTLLGPEGKPLVTWRLAKAPVRFDTQAFREAKPDLYAAFSKPGFASRRFLVK
jgi:putative phage-type endonuclease